MFPPKRNIEEEFSDLLKQGSRCLQSICDVDARISDSLEKADFELLAEVLSARQAAVQELQILRERFGHLNGRKGEWAGPKAENDATLSKIQRLVGLLVSQGEEHIAALRQKMDEVTDTLREIRRGKQTLAGYRGSDERAANAAFTG